MKLQQWAAWAEITASVAVVVTLVVLVKEVQGNTRTLERQAALDRTSALTTPFFESPELAETLAKIKAVDGGDELPRAFMDRYGLTYAEATMWERHLWVVWAGIEADFLQAGATAENSLLIQSLSREPDNQIYIDFLVDYGHAPDFIAYVESLTN